MTLARDINLVRVVLCLFAFSTGLGIEFPLIYILGNFSFFDILLCTSVFIFLRFLKFSSLSLFPIVIGIIGLCSICYNALSTSSYHQVELEGFPIIFRWMYYGFLLCLFYTYCKNLRDLHLYLFCILLGVLTLAIYSWYNWTSQSVYFFGFPTLAFIRELNGNTLGFYFCSSISILIFLYKKNYINVISFVLFFIVVILSTVSTISKGAILTSALVIILYTKFSFGSVMLVGTLGSLAIYYVSDLAQRRWAASEGSNQERISLITKAYEMFLTSPVLGVGPKGYNTTGFTKVTDAHNALFNILAEYGLLGFSVYLIFVIYLLLFRIPKIIKYSSYEGYFLLIYFVSIQMLGMTTGLTYSDKISWIIIGSVLGGVRHSIYNKHRIQ